MFYLGMRLERGDFTQSHLRDRGLCDLGPEKCKKPEKCMKVVRLLLSLRRFKRRRGTSFWIGSSGSKDDPMRRSITLCLSDMLAAIPWSEYSGVCALECELMLGGCQRAEPR